MLVDSCIPVIPSADLEKSLRFWVEGLGMSMIVPCGRTVAWSDAWFINERHDVKALRDDDGYSHCFGVATNNSG